MNTVSALVMFDSGATHSFVSLTFATRLERGAKPLPYPLEVEVADDRIVVVRDVYRGCKIEISGVVFPIDLIPIAMRELCVIIGMDWMEKFRANILCYEKQVRVLTSDGEKMTFQGDAWWRIPMFCSAAKAKRYLQREGARLPGLRS